MASSGGTSGVLVADGDGLAGSTNQQVGARAYVWGAGNNWQRVFAPGSLGDGGGGTNSVSAALIAQGSTANGFPRVRIADKFVNLSAVAIGTEATIWTPAAGKKFRLMGVFLDQGTATGAVTLRDNTAGSTILILPAEPINTNTGVFLGNGILSAAANNVLTAQGVATETLTGFVYGTEE